MSIYFIPIVTLLGAALFRCRSIRALVALFRPAGSIRALVALFRPAGSIRAFGYGYCPLGNTPSRSPYFATAQYGLLATAIARWAIRLRGRPISLSLDTGSLSPGVALRLPRAVFWRPFRALYSPSPNLSSLLTKNTLFMMFNR